MIVEIWSDVVCPWCYIGKRRVEAALELFEHREQVDVIWRSYELDPTATVDSHGVDLVHHLAQKYGTDRLSAMAMMARVSEVAASVGLSYRFDLARRSSTFDAHRLIHLAATTNDADAMKERLMRAYFCEGEDVADHDTLVRLAGEIGLGSDSVSTMLRGAKFADDVRSDEAAAKEFGITGVPCFVIDRAYAMSGAQEPTAILEALEEAWDASTKHAADHVNDDHAVTN